MKFKLSEGMFFLSYGMYLFVTIINTSMFAKYITGLPITLVFILSVSILVAREFLFKKYTLKKIAGLSVFAIIAVMMVIYSGLFTTITIMCMFIYCGRNVSFEKIAKFTLILSSILVMMIVISSFIGVIPNYTITSSGRTRSYLGFRYALHTQTYIFNITALVIYLKQNKLKILTSILLLGLNYYFFCQTDSRLSFYMSCMLIMLALYIKYRPDSLPKAKTMTRILCYSFIICMVVSICFAVYYDSSIRWMEKWNVLLSNRLYYSHQSLQYYPISVWGQDTEFIGAGLDIYGNRYSGVYFYVDCFYVLILERYGLFLTAIVLILLSYSLFRCRKRNEWILFIILVLCAVHFIIDDLFLYLNYNTFWFLIGSELSKGLRKSSRQGRKVVRLKFI